MNDHDGDTGMSNTREPGADPDQPMIYHIRLAGQLGPAWADWFDGLSITLEDSGETLLAGPVADQAALHGLLKRVRDLGMPLISVNPVPTSAAPHPRSLTEERK